MARKQASKAPPKRPRAPDAAHDGAGGNGMADRWSYSLPTAVPQDVALGPGEGHGREAGDSGFGGLGWLATICGGILIFCVCAAVIPQMTVTAWLGLPELATLLADGPRDVRADAHARRPTSAEMQAWLGARDGCARLAVATCGPSRACMDAESCLEAAALARDADAAPGGMRRDLFVACATALNRLPPAARCR